MKIAYLIDKDSLGGGCEYIRRKRDEARGTGNETAVFYSDKGECRAAVLDAWGAEEIVVNHLKALLQLLGRPWEKPHGRVRFVVHGLHVRQYEWRVREAAAKGLAALPSLVGLSVRRFLRRRLEAWLYHRCDEIVALTESDRADILRLYGKDLKVVVEPNTLAGWTPQLTEELPEAWVTRWGSSRPQYICIGRFDYQKGQDRWIKEKGRRKKEEGIEERTLFIGDGETLGACKKLAAKLGVAERCVFAGAIPDAERYLKCADIVVSPSRWEGMPYLMMKARALGCRVLATDCPGNRDVLAGYDKWEKLEVL